MQDTTDKAPILMENERKGGRMSVRRKFTNLLEYFYNPFPHMPSRKKLRLSLQASIPAIAAEADSLNALCPALV
jgi:hypothetical protein